MEGFSSARLKPRPFKPFLFVPRILWDATLGGDGVQVPGQELFSLTFEFHEHDAVAELGMAGDDESSDVNGVAVEPEGASNADAD